MSFVWQHCQRPEVIRRTVEGQMEWVYGKLTVKTSSTEHCCSLWTRTLFICLQEIWMLVSLSLITCIWTWQQPVLVRIYISSGVAHSRREIMRPVWFTAVWVQLHINIVLQTQLIWPISNNRGKKWWLTLHPWLCWCRRVKQRSNLSLYAGAIMESDHFVWKYRGAFFLKQITKANELIAL